MGTLGATLTRPWRGLARAGRGVLDELFPLDSEAGLSQATQTGWKVDAPDAYCPRCAATSGPGAATASGCAFCAGMSLPWQRAVRLALYQKPVSEWIVALKFARQWTWAPWFGEQLARAIGDGAAPAPGRGATTGRVAVCWVPMHWLRRCRRGYNQAQLIAQSLARQRRWPAADILRRKRYTPPQTSLPPWQRLANVRGSFAIHPVDLSGWTIWLVDDVKTTGSTLAACARLLRSAGAPQVNIAVVAGADPKGAGFRYT